MGIFINTMHCNVVDIKITSVGAGLTLGYAQHNKTHPADAANEVATLDVFQKYIK